MSSRTDVPESPPWWRRRAIRTALVLCLGFASGALVWLPSRRFVSATQILVDLAGPAPAAPPARPITIRDLSVDHAGGSARAHLYLPGVAPRRCLVIGHGVHYKSIDEPRLVRFSNELAKSGAVVLTPELSDLADYRITASGVEVLAESVKTLSKRCPAGRQVGLLGFSFAGGLSLLAALEKDVSDRLAYVASVGGYHDLRRVLSFLLSDVVQTPEGPAPRKAHEYGLVVLLYENLDALVPEEDRGVMSEAIRAWLTEDRARAWTLASLATTQVSEDLFMALVKGETRELRSRLAALLAGAASALAVLSPAGRLHEIPVPVFLLHGTGDRVIPPEETTWASLELGERPHRALVTPLIEHVELDAHFRIADALDLITFMAGLI